MYYLKIMKDILTGKRVGGEDSSITVITYASFLGCIYKTLAVGFLLAALGLSVFLCKNINMIVSELFILPLVMGALIFVCVIFFFVFWAMSNETKDVKDKDKDKVLSELTAVATIIAVIIAALSLRH